MISAARKLLLFIDYSRVNESLEERTFRMDQLGDLAAVLKPNDSLFRAEISDAYYHLRIRACDRELLAFKVEGAVYLPLFLNCGLSVAPWFFTKAMKPVVAHLREKGHRVFSYLDDFFGSARGSGPHAASAADTRSLGEEVIALFARLGLLLHPHKCDFSGSRRLEIFGIVVDSEKEMFLLSVANLAKIEFQARRLLRYAAQHRRHVRVTDIRSFAGLRNSVTLAVVDARLRLRELFNCLTTGHGHTPPNITEKRAIAPQTATSGMSDTPGPRLSPIKALRGQKEAEGCDTRRCATYSSEHASAPTATLDARSGQRLTPWSLQVRVCPAGVRHGIVKSPLPGFSTSSRKALTSTSSSCLRLYTHCAALRVMLGAGRSNSSPTRR